jgi:hypothetical protein
LFVVAVAVVGKVRDPIEYPPSFDAAQPPRQGPWLEGSHGKQGPSKGSPVLAHRKPVAVPEENG